MPADISAVPRRAVLKRALLALSLAIAPAAAQTSLHRINVGGAAFTDAQGKVWQADQYFNTGTASTTTAPIANTTDDALFQTIRWDGSAAPEMLYTLPVAAAGQYQVRLLFCEKTFTAAGIRVFDVKIEGQTVLDNLDIFAQAGANTALVKEFTVGVTDGNINVEFVHQVENPSISAIEVLSVPVPPSGAVIRVNAGGGAFTDNLGQVWAADKNFNTGNTYSTTSAIANTVNDALYQTERWDASTAPELMYTIPVASGAYKVRLHFAEIYQTNVGTRVFDVKLENALVLDNLDIVAQAGANTALVKEFTINVTDGAVNIELVRGVENPKISAIEILPGTVAPTAIRVNAGGGAFTDNLGQVWAADKNFNTGNTYSTTSAIGNTVNDALYQSERWDASTAPELMYTFSVSQGSYKVRLHFAEIYQTNVGTRVFDVKLENALVLDNLDIVAQAGANTALVKEFTVNVTDGAVNIEFIRGVDNPKISAIEILPDAGAGHDDPYLHVVIEADPYSVDYDGNGSQVVHLQGTGSHTHEPGRQLIVWQWTQGAAVIANTESADILFPLGAHTVSLTIKDDGSPQRSLIGSSAFQVVPPSRVPGTLVLSYRAGASNPLALLDQVPAQADHGKVQAGLAMSSQEAGFTVPGMARFLSTIDLPAAGSYVFQASGGLDRRLFVNGSAVSGALSLPAGPATVEARFAFQGTADFPFAVTYGFNGGAQAAVNPNQVNHAEIDLPPFLNTLTPEGPEAGGNSVTLTGLGFHPSSAVTVQWGGATLSGSSLAVKPGSIQLIAPPGSGTVQVSVQTPNGATKSLKYLYKPGQLPIEFAISTLAAVNQPTTGTWGPDGRLYVAGLDGKITILTLNDAYDVTATQVINTLSGLYNKDITGIAFNPKEAGGPLRLYVSHGQLYANGGACFSGSAVHTGQVSVLTDPDFSTAVPLITGLPVSNHDHSVNGLEFDHAGDLFIAVGGNTNAGIRHCALGDLPASPLTSAILKATITKPAFNGQVKYVLTSNGQVNMDAVFGDQVDVKAGVDVSVWASGFRNPYDLVLATTDRFYATDNGPNTGFGVASTSATTQNTIHPNDHDELVLVAAGAYYGHPNRNRGRYDSRQNVYYGSAAASIAGVFTQALATFPSSTDGIFEYRAETFGGAMRGNLILQKFQGTTYRVVLGTGGTTVSSQQSLFSETFKGLDVTSGPGGVIFGIAYSDNLVRIAKPVAAGSGFVPFDIHPWRAPAAGGAAFEIGGMGFGTLTNTTVTIGGIPAQLTSVTASRIKGTLPANATPPADLVDVDVKVGTVLKTLPGAFRFLAP